MHVETGAAEGINDQDWYPMMSAHKLPIAIHALRQAERHVLDLATTVTLASDDRRPGFSPLARLIEKNGPQTATLCDLLSAIIRVSDNTASDRLLREAGGPAAVAATLRELRIDGVDVSRYELEFAADYFADMLVRLVKGALLNRENTAWLMNAMTEMHARDTRLRAGLPSGTLVGLRRAHLVKRMASVRPTMPVRS